MKRHIAFWAVLCLGAVFFVGCTAKNTEPQAAAVTKQDLVHKKFVLAAVDGKPFVTKVRAPTLDFNEGLRVSGAVCNRFNGQAELEDGVLTVKHMASTRMFCPEQELNTLESDFSLMLMHGASIFLAGNTLTLRSDSRSIEFVEQENGK